MKTTQLVDFVRRELKISDEQAEQVVETTNRLYIETMTRRFGNEKLTDKLKRTNPFLLRIRNIKTVREWADIQVRGLLFSSEEEAVGHVLEQIAHICHPKSIKPEFSDDLDFQVNLDNIIRGYQIKMSWDCMPMSSRKNLSKTIEKLRTHYNEQGKEFIGIFASCYGKATTTNPKGQKYVALRSRDLWTEISGGIDVDYDVRVGEVCATLCAESRTKLINEIVSPMIERLIKSALPIIGDGKGNIDYRKLFRAINK